MRRGFLLHRATPLLASTTKSWASIVGHVLDELRCVRLHRRARVLVLCVLGRPMRLLRALRWRRLMQRARLRQFFAVFEDAANPGSSLVLGRCGGGGNCRSALQCFNCGVLRIRRMNLLHASMVLDSRDDDEDPVVAEDENGDALLLLPSRWAPRRTAAAMAAPSRTESRRGRRGREDTVGTEDLVDELPKTPYPEHLRRQCWGDMPDIGSTHSILRRAATRRAAATRVSWDDMFDDF